MVPGGGGEPPEALPGVEPDVVMVAAGADERGGAPHALRELKAQDPAVEAQGPFQISDLEMDVADPDAGIETLSVFHGSHLSGLTSPWVDATHPSYPGRHTIRYEGFDCRLRSLTLVRG